MPMPASIANEAAKRRRSRRAAPSRRATSRRGTRPRRSRARVPSSRSSASMPEASRRQTNISETDDRDGDGVVVKRRAAAGDEPACLHDDRRGNRADHRLRACRGCSTAISAKLATGSTRGRTDERARGSSAEHRAGAGCAREARSPRTLNVEPRKLRLAAGEQQVYVAAGDAARAARRAPRWPGRASTRSPCCDERLVDRRRRCRSHRRRRSAIAARELPAAASAGMISAAIVAPLRTSASACARVETGTGCDRLEEPGAHSACRVDRRLAQAVIIV